MTIDELQDLYAYVRGGIDEENCTHRDLEMTKKMLGLIADAMDREKVNKCAACGGPAGVGRKYCPICAAN